MITQRDRSGKLIKAILPTLLLVVAGILLVCSANAAIKAGAKVDGGNLTLDANNATVGELLETIARAASVDIFIARGFQTKSEKMTFRFEGEPLEEAVKRILRGYNYAAIYEKEGNDFRIAALKIYPEGKAGGDVIPLFSGGRTPVYEEKNRRGETVTVLVNTGGDIVTRGNMTERSGLVGPSQTEVAAGAAPGNGLNAPWLALQLQLEQDEAERFSDLLLLRRQAEATAGEPQRRQALAMAYADEVAKFVTLKKANRNKVESLKRINLLQEVTQH